jgi:hypothetical protein
MEAFTLIGFKTIYKQKFTVMAKMLLISDEDLKSLIQEAVTNAVDGITKKIASRAARIYNNQIFIESRREDDHLSCGAGDSGRAFLLALQAMERFPLPGAGLGRIIGLYDSVQRLSGDSYLYYMPALLCNGILAAAQTDMGGLGAVMVAGGQLLHTAYGCALSCLVA